MAKDSIDSSNKEIADFEQWCQESWGMGVRSNQKLLVHDAPQIRNHVGFEKASHCLKVHIAEKLILESCSRKGSFCESGDVTWYIREFGRELKRHGDVFTGRRVQPLRAALLLLANLHFSSALPLNSSDCEHIRAGGGAMSAMYLLSQLEFLFRKKSRYLKEDGTIKRPIPVTLCVKAGLNNGKRPKKPISNGRINNIDQALVLYLYRNNQLPAKRLKILEEKLLRCKTTFFAIASDACAIRNTINGHCILGIAGRLKTVRHPVMHGALPDPSSEAMFFGLLIAIFYYGERTPS
ncbi:MAG: hypothetical protein HY670_05535 [Chloroflexi bacterium]|nr:hypothetical protein [Chloroflexota bacterium]